MYDTRRGRIAQVVRRIISIKLIRAMGPHLFKHPTHASYLWVRKSPVGMKFPSGSSTPTCYPKNLAVTLVWDGALGGFKQPLAGPGGTFFSAMGTLQATEFWSSDHQMFCVSGCQPGELQATLECLTTGLRTAVSYTKPSHSLERDKNLERRFISPSLSTTFVATLKNVNSIILGLLLDTTTVGQFLCRNDVAIEADWGSGGEGPSPPIKSKESHQYAMARVMDPPRLRGLHVLHPQSILAERTIWHRFTNSSTLLGGRDETFDGWARHSGPGQRRLLRWRHRPCHPIDYPTFELIW